MESELLTKPWPTPEKNFHEKPPSGSIAPFWEENFQDLSDWCVDPQSINRFHIPTPTQGQRDYHIDEQITAKNSGVKDNYVNLSHIKSGLKDITGIGGNWTVDNNTQSTEMSFEGSLPIGQDQFNTVTDMSDVWSDLLPTTSNIDEQQTIDSMKLILNRNENVPDPSLDLISETIDTWFPIITTDNDISCDDLVTINQDDIVLDSYQSASANSTDDNFEKKQLLKDILLTADVPNSFDLLSYVCDESGNLLDKKNIEEKPELTTSDSVDSSQVTKTKKSRVRREKKISQARAKAEPYVPPLKINIKDKKLSSKKRKTSQPIDDESGNYTDSDSDTQTSDHNYRELREKNNRASRKSRINKKVKESEMLKKASDLEKNNIVLKMKVEELEKLVTSMRTALLQSALKKEK